MESASKGVIGHDKLHSIFSLSDVGNRAPFMQSKHWNTLIRGQEFRCKGGIHTFAQSCAREFALEAGTLFYNSFCQHSTMKNRKMLFMRCVQFHSLIFDKWFLLVAVLSITILIEDFLPLINHNWHTKKHGQMEKMVKYCMITKCITWYTDTNVK